MWKQNLINEIESLKGKYVLEDMLVKIDKFLNFGYIDIDEAQEVKAIAREKHDKTYAPEVDVNVLQKQVLVLSASDDANYSADFLYEQIGKDGLAELVRQGKVTLARYKEVVGEDCELTVDELKTLKIKFIDDYKHEARLYFEYGNVGGIQRFLPEDIQSIQLSLMGIQNGLVETVVWKYKGDLYEVADEAYLTGMLAEGGLLITKAFEVEAKIVEAIKTLETIEELKAYDEKAEFDKIFFHVEEVEVEIPEVVEPEAPVEE